MRANILFAALVCTAFLTTGCLLGADAEATRADLALAYAELELALADHPLVEADVRPVNTAFDQASIAFFLRNYSFAVASIRELTARVRTGAAADGATRGMAALRGRAIPRTVVPGQALEIELRTFGLPVAPAPPRTVPLRLVPLAGGPALEQEATLPLGLLGRVDTCIAVAGGAGLAPGAYDVQLGSDGGRFTLARLWVVTGSLDAQRTANEARLAALSLSVATPALEQALAAVRARNALLTDRPADAQTAVAFDDPNRLAADVAAEIDALAAGRDPFRERAGEYWRVARVGGIEVPLRVYTPAGAAEGTPRPLLVVLHGAGGDENMFFQGYGAGRVRGLADELGLLVIAPRTELLVGNPERFGPLLEAVRYTYPLDDSRVMLLGHSLGAVTVVELAKRWPGQFAAGVCFAGAGNIGGARGLPPTRVYIGEQDPISPPRVVRGAVEQARAAGEPVELVPLPGYGHTLGVGARLEEAVRWLAAQRRTS